MATSGTDDDRSNIYAALSSPIRRRILDSLCAQGSMDLKEIAESSGLQQVTARHHLLVMERAGLIRSRERHDGLPGRPRLYFDVVNRYQNIALPKRQYAMLAEHLLDEHVSEGGEERAAEMMRRIGAKVGKGLVEAAREAKGGGELSLADLEAHIIPALDEFGSCAAVTHRTESSIRIRMRNCIFFELAKSYPEVVCEGHAEIYRTIGKLLGDYDAVVESCMAHGSKACITILRKKSS